MFFLEIFFRNGLVYFDVPIDDNDYVIVPPLENFVMNRVLVIHWNILYICISPYFINIIITHADWLNEERLECGRALCFEIQHAHNPATYSPPHSPTPSW